MYTRHPAKLAVRSLQHAQEVPLCGASSGRCVGCMFAVVYHVTMCWKVKRLGV